MRIALGGGGSMAKRYGPYRTITISKQKKSITKIESFELRNTWMLTKGTLGGIQEGTPKAAPSPTGTPG